MIKHQEERLKKQRRKGGFDYPKSSETAEANKRTLEIEVDKDDRLDIELPEEKKFNEEKIVEKVSLKHKEVTVKRNQMVENGSISRAGKGATLPQDKIVVEGSQFNDLENDGIVKDESIATDEKMTEDDSLEIKLKLETEENLRKLEIERLAEENLRKQKIEGLLRRTSLRLTNCLFIHRW